MSEKPGIAATPNTNKKSVGGILNYLKHFK